MPFEPVRKAVAQRGLGSVEGFYNRNNQGECRCLRNQLTNTGVTKADKPIVYSTDGTGVPMTALQHVYVDHDEVHTPSLEA